MKPLLMGAEVEYSTSGRVDGRIMSPEEIHGLLLREIRRRHDYLRDFQSPVGVYLANGCRCYCDTGSHTELCTPEVTNPHLVAVYDRAGEKILMAAREDVLKSRPGVEISITKSNVNLCTPDSAAWGQHEAFTCWVPVQDAAIQLIPHLVSRVPYAGAGCLSAHPSGMGYELSQRART